MLLIVIKTTAAQNDVWLSYHGVRELYFLAVIYAETILNCCKCTTKDGISHIICIKFNVYFLVSTVLFIVAISKLLTFFELDLDFESRMKSDTMLNLIIGSRTYGDKTLLEYMFNSVL